MIGWETILVRLVLAAFLGGIIGYQRERSEKPAGFRTHALVCMGSALLMLVSYYPFFNMGNADPSRIAAGAITGIGFLGAGAIISQGGIVKGLTTAASIWIMAAIGFVVGIGLYVPALVGTTLTLLILTFFKTLEMSLLGGYCNLEFILEDRPGKLGEVASSLGSLHVGIKRVDLKCDEELKMCTTRMALDLPHTVHKEDVIKKVLKIKGINGLKWIE
ncbi:MgtC/SapB family protein [Candidatus Oleimmundimicrobium sp.]|uniref:MgtC/SapB family protein n=1 Tax=Candidatus Oleimmundimicrobium sp. TaxID=3060597 RepID=UPI0027228BC6|nr:MgtC/SapB family protein [Candidatus Oleimmundimicrobium sp.]MDO8886917.1 MgtC/SapB family protein [Candidatus Oleimmundimicrobium sp.]